MGQKIDISTENGIKLYEEILANAQETNKMLGYGDDSKEWDKKKYNVTLRKINKLKNENEKIKKNFQKHLDNSKK